MKTITIKGMSCQHCVTAVAKALSGIDGLDVEVICNPLAEEVLFHRSLVRDYAIKHLADAGITLSEKLLPGSGMISISVATVEASGDSGPATLATTLNIDLNRASLCLLETTSSTRLLLLYGKRTD